MDEQVVRQILVDIARLEAKLDAHNTAVLSSMVETKATQEKLDERLTDVEKKQVGLHVKLHSVGGAIALLVSGAMGLFFKH